MHAVETLVANRYLVDTTQPLPEAGGGVPAFVCTDQHGMHAALMALCVQPGRPPRADALGALIGQGSRDILLPLAHGPGGAAGNAVGDAYYVICPAPPSRPLSAVMRQWSEAELLDQVLRPAAQALALLAARGTTHRAIRPNNIFRAKSGAAILGAAWAEPPASLQPALYEPPYIALCMPSGRGNGSIADDIYALGVLLLTLALGRSPMAALDEATVLRRKVDVGSFQAIVGTERLPGMIADLARGMLAEDPDHRPPPDLLADPVAARGRRVAARPPRRAPRAFDIGQRGAFNARGVAWAMTQDPAAGIANLRSGQVERWLRRDLGDANLASVIEEATRLRSTQSEADQFADSTLLTKAIAVLDPLAPLCWQGTVLWPDGLGPVLAAMREDPVVSLAVMDMLAVEAVGVWAAARGDRADEAYLRREARQWRSLLTNGAGEPANGSGLMRLGYQLNPLMPCASPVLAGLWVARIQDLLPALEAQSARADHAQQAPYDPEIAAFVNARARQRDERDEAARHPQEQGVALARTQLWLYANLQARQHHDLPLPGMARWLVARAGPLIDSWEHRPQRETIARHLAELAPIGQLLPLLAALENQVGRTADHRGVVAAATEAARIDAELRVIAEGGTTRAEVARRIGQEMATGVGLAGLAGALTALAFG